MTLFGVFVTGTLGFLLQTVALVVFFVIAVFAVLRLMNRDAAGSWLHWGRTKAGEAGDYATTLDPAAQMKQAARDAAAELKGADNALIAAEGMRLKLTDQIDLEIKTKNNLEAQVARFIRPTSEGGKGLPENDPLVVEKLKRIRDLDESIALTQDQVKVLDDDYKKNLRLANTAGEKIALTLAEADRMQVQLDLGEQNAKVRAMLSKYNPTAVTSKLASIDKYREAAKDKLRGYAAQQKVAVDRNVGDDMDDDDDVTPDTDPALGNVLDRIKSSRGKPTTTDGQ